MRSDLFQDTRVFSKTAKLVSVHKVIFIAQNDITLVKTERSYLDYIAFTLKLVIPACRNIDMFFHSWRFDIYVNYNND